MLAQTGLAQTEEGARGGEGGDVGVAARAFGKIKVGEQEYPKRPSAEKHEICGDPISADPI